MARRARSLNVATPPYGAVRKRTSGPPAPLSRTWSGAGLDGDAVVQQRGKWRLVNRTLVFSGFMLYIFVITTYRFALGDLAIGMALLGLLFQKDSPRFPRPLIWYAVLLAWCALGYAGSNYPNIVVDELINSGKLGLILLVMVNALRTRSQLRAFIVFWLACFAFYPLRGAYFTYFLGGHTVDGRAVWNYIYNNPNDLAGLTILMLGVCVGVLVTDKNKWFRWAALTGTIMLSLLIFLTQSRGGFLGFSVFALLALLINRHRTRALGIVAVAALIVALVAPSKVWNRLSGITDATDTEHLEQLNDDGSAAQRFDIWRTAVRITFDHPLFGVGWGAYQQANGAYAPRQAGAEIKLGERDAHSTYLRTSAELGIPGLVIFMTLIGGCFAYAEKTRRACRELMPRAAQQLFFAEAALAGFLVAGIFGSYSRLAFFYIYVVLIWIIARACQDDMRLIRNRVQAPAVRV